MSMVSFATYRDRHLPVFAAAALGLCVSAPLGAQTQQPATAPSVQPAPLPYGPVIVDRQAQAALSAAEAEARRLGYAVAIAIVEPSGDLVMFKKLEGTHYYTSDSAMNKARSSARLKRPTRNFQEGVKTNPNLLSVIPGAVPAAGGVPITVDGKIIGAIGVSTGRSLDLDEQIATAGANAVR